MSQDLSYKAKGRVYDTVLGNDPIQLRLSYRIEQLNSTKYLQKRLLK